MWGRVLVVQKTITDMAAHQATGDRLINDAIEVGTMAVEAEKASRYPEAKAKYMESVGLFLKAFQMEVNTRKKELLKAKAIDFLQRAEQLTEQMRDAENPLLSEARKLENEASAAEAGGEYLKAKVMHTRAIERYLEVLCLESSSTPKGLALRREAEGVFLRAERVQSLLKAREQDSARVPLERTAQLAAAATEASNRGELE